MCAYLNSLPQPAHRGIRTYNVLVKVGETLVPLVIGKFYFIVTCTA